MSVGCTQLGSLNRAREQRQLNETGVDLHAVQWIRGQMKKSSKERDTVRL